MNKDGVVSNQNEGWCSEVEADVLLCVPCAAMWLSTSQHCSYATGEQHPCFIRQFTINTVEKVDCVSPPLM